jgi:hypothetical protein
MNYRFEVIENNDKKIEYLEKNSHHVARLLNGCFGTDFKNFSDIQWIKNMDVFICKDGAMTIGIATGERALDVIVTDEKIITFDSTRYIYIYGKNYMHDIMNGTNIKFSPRIIGPCIQSLCKDMRYKNVGSYLIKNIEKYYKSKGVKILYLVAESAIYKNELNAAHCANDRSLDSWNNILKWSNKYKSSQPGLVKYYNALGFMRYPDTYEIGFIPMCQDQYLQFFTFFNVFAKTL